MSHKARWVLVCAGFGLIFVGGCAGDPNRRLPVSGTVTFQGRLLERGNIQFFFTDGTPGAAAGAMIQAGRYDVPGIHGLVPATYRVLISFAEESKTRPEGWVASSPPTEERIPPEYSSYEKSKVTIEVTPQGPNVFDFTIP